MNWLQPRLHLKVSQKQILTPGLVQMVSVLALNRLELREMINQEMAANPMLEELGDDGLASESYTEETFVKAETEKVPETEAPNPFDEFDFGSFFGQYLDTDKPIVSLQSLSPVYADFSLPQQDLATIKVGMAVRITTDTYPNRPFKGKLTAINPDLDTLTRSVRLQATLDNPDQLLRPGMFARAEVLLPSSQSVLVVPATAILSAPYGDSVFVIESSTNALKPGLIARQQFIRTSRARGDFVSVASGLKAGDKVASAGLFKLRNGVAVAVNNDIVPKASETPRPPER